MVLIAKAGSLLNARPALSPVPRLPERSCSTRAARQTGLKRTVAAAKAPADCLQQTATQWTGVAGLLAPLLLSDPAFAATPDGEHLTKVCFVVLRSFHHRKAAVNRSNRIAAVVSETQVESPCRELWSA